MNILLAAKHIHTGVRPIGGVQTWCSTVGAKLYRLGHNVDYWEPTTPLPTKLFDAGIFANVACTKPVAGLCKTHLVVSHGIIPYEKPEGHNVVYTSEEVRDHWGGSGPIIRQPIDFDLWTPVKRVAPTTLLWFSYRPAPNCVMDVADDLWLSVDQVCFSPTADGVRFARERMKDAACVLASGRAVIEAMACEVPVVLCDNREYQTPLMDTKIGEAHTTNYSGRGGVGVNRVRLREAVQQAMRRQPRLRLFARSMHDSANITQQLLAQLT